MSSALTIDSASKSKNLDSISLLRLYIQNVMLKLMKIKTDNSNLTQKSWQKKWVLLILQLE